MSWSIKLPSPLLYFVFLLVAQLNAQAPEDSLQEFDFGGLFYLDSVVVQASRQGFEVNDFIQMVQEDKSFYTSFQQLRKINYQAKHQIQLFPKSNLKRPKQSATKDHYQSTIEQTYDGRCRRIQFLTEDHSKKYFKGNGKHRYYTGKLLDRLFQSEECSDGNPVRENGSAGDKSSGHIAELKKLIFSPGQEADVPLIGSKTAIFSKKMAPYYNFSITSKKFKGAITCYVFTAQVKPEFQERKADKTVIKFLETYFEKENFTIVARNYTLQYASAFFDFDIDMSIECRPFGESFLPQLIQYDGFWDIPGRKPEIAKFTIEIE